MPEEESRHALAPRAFHGAFPPEAGAASAHADLTSHELRHFSVAIRPARPGQNGSFRVGRYILAAIWSVPLLRDERLEPFLRLFHGEPLLTDEPDEFREVRLEIQAHGQGPALLPNLVVDRLLGGALRRRCGRTRSVRCRLGPAVAHGPDVRRRPATARARLLTPAREAEPAVQPAP